MIHGNWICEFEMKHSEEISKFSNYSDCKEKNNFLASISSLRDTEKILEPNISSTIHSQSDICAQILNVSYLILCDNYIISQLFKDTEDIEDFFRIRKVQIRSKILCFILYYIMLLYKLVLNIFFFQKIYIFKCQYVRFNIWNKVKIAKNLIIFIL